MILASPTCFSACRMKKPTCCWPSVPALVGGKAGVLVLKHPGQKDTDALVVLSWADWVDLHGVPEREGEGQ